MTRIFLLLCLAVLFSGCAGQRIKPVEFQSGGEKTELLNLLSSYNKVEGYFRVLGRAKTPNGVVVDFGARGGLSAGSRMDAVAGPSSKLIFSASCEESHGCAVFLPDDFVVYRNGDALVSSWFTQFLIGRVPMIGEISAAGTVEGDRRALRIEGANGQWQLVTFGADGLPEQVLYGEADGPPKLEIGYGEFLKAGKYLFPARIFVGGEKEGEEFTLMISKVLWGEDPPAGGFRLRVPEGAKTVDSLGRDTWKKLGMFWTPGD